MSRLAPESARLPEVSGGFERFESYFYCYWRSDSNISAMQLAIPVPLGSKGGLFRNLVLKAVCVLTHAPSSGRSAGVRHYCAFRRGV